MSIRQVGKGEVQRLAYPSQMDDVNETDRTITFRSSTEDVDRYGDIVRVNGWRTANYEKNPVFLWAHDSSAPPIGQCVKISKEHGALVQQIKFADANTYAFADTIFKLYKGGYLRAVSVGFIADEFEQRADGAGYEFKSQELLELSAVPIPANASALAVGKNYDPGAYAACDILAAITKTPAPEKTMLLANLAEVAAEIERRQRK